LPERNAGDIISKQLIAGRKEQGMPSIGGWEWLIILVIVVIIFGVGKLPEIGGALGRSIKEFRESSKTEESSEVDDSAAKESSA
jgi:sec-independent protein translocase protein TatA